MCVCMCMFITSVFVYVYIGFIFECIYLGCCFNTIQVIIIMALWQLVHLGTAMYSYMLLAFQNPSSVQLITRATSMTNMKKTVGSRNTYSAQIYIYNTPYIHTPCKS